MQWLHARGISSVDRSRGLAPGVGVRAEATGAVLRGLVVAQMTRAKHVWQNPVVPQTGTPVRRPRDSCNGGEAVSQRKENVFPLQQWARFSVHDGHSAARRERIQYLHILALFLRINPDFGEVRISAERVAKDSGQPLESNCPGRKPPKRAVKRPARLYKSPIQN